MSDPWILFVPVFATVVWVVGATWSWFENRPQATSAAVEPAVADELVRIAEARLTERLCTLHPSLWDTETLTVSRDGRTAMAFVVPTSSMVVRIEAVVL